MREIATIDYDMTSNRGNRPRSGVRSGKHMFRGRLGKAAGLFKIPVFRFILFFVINLIVASIAYAIITGELFFVVRWFMSATAWIVGQTLGLTSSDVSISGTLVAFGAFPVRIVEECTGIYEMLIFSAAVMAFPASLKKKAIGLLTGIPAMYLFNILRILMLIVVGRYFHSAFEFMHLYFWQVTMIVMITSVWMAWILKVVRDEKTPAAGT